MIAGQAILGGNTILEGDGILGGFDDLWKQRENWKSQRARDNFLEVAALLHGFHVHDGPREDILGHGELGLAA